VIITIYIADLSLNRSNIYCRDQFWSGSSQRSITIITAIDHNHIRDQPDHGSSQHYSDQSSERSTTIL